MPKPKKAKRQALKSGKCGVTEKEFLAARVRTYIYQHTGAILTMPILEGILDLIDSHKPLHSLRVGGTK